MGQMGFFDLGNRYSGLDAKNEPLLKMTGWFRGTAALPDLSAYTPATEIAMMRHERQAVRLFSN